MIDMTTAWPAALPTGIWIQLYLGSMRNIDVARMIAEAKRLKCGVVFHGATNHNALAQSCRTARVPFAFSFGLDGSGTGAEKGDRVGKALASVTDVSFGVLDAEGAWDSHTGPDDHTDERNALDLMKALRTRVGRLVLGDQGWFAMESHGDERKIAKPLGEGGVFAGFPSDEFASELDFRAPQLYFRNDSGANAYARWRAWHERDWAQHETSLARLGLVRPRCWTLQGYGGTPHRERPQDLIDALLRGRDRLSILWWDQEYGSQWATTAIVIEAVRRLIDGGHAPVGRSSVDCVRSWQRSLNVADDGACGWLTLTRAGFVKP